MNIPRNKINPEFFPILKLTQNGKTHISIVLCSAAPTEYGAPHLWVPRYNHIIVAYGDVQAWASVYEESSHLSRKTAVEHALQVGRNYVAQEYVGRSKRITHVCAARPCRTLSGTVNRALALLLQANPGLDIIGELE